MLQLNRFTPFFLIFSLFNAVYADEIANDGDSGNVTENRTIWIAGIILGVIGVIAFTLFITWRVWLRRRHGRPSTANRHWKNTITPYPFALQPAPLPPSRSPSPRNRSPPFPLPLHYDPASSYSTLIITRQSLNSAPRERPFSPPSSRPQQTMDDNPPQYDESVHSGVLYPLEKGTGSHHRLPQDVPPIRIITAPFPLPPREVYSPEKGRTPGSLTSPYTPYSMPVPTPSAPSPISPYQ